MRLLHVFFALVSVSSCVTLAVIYVARSRHPLTESHVSAPVDGGLKLEAKQTPRRTEAKSSAPRKEVEATTSPTFNHPELITVVMPVYNGSKYVAGALGSVLNQTYEPLRVIVSIDASDDAHLSVQAVKSLIQRSSAKNVDVVVHAERM